MHIGIDVGGTNTDAVLMNHAQVIATVKQRTSSNVTDGIISAISALRATHPFAPAQIQALMIGTTHFSKALADARDLSPTAALRLGLTTTAALPPLVGWPQSLRTALQARSYLAHGGHEFDGRLITPLNPEQIRRAAADMATHGITAVAISAVFSPINNELELHAAQIIREELGEHVAISLSHHLGRVGLLERENATILNAALRGLADDVITTLQHTLNSTGFHCPLFVSQNDGTLMPAAQARRFPLATFASGLTNAMRGAVATAGVTSCTVIDVGGTSSDVAVVDEGFPRQASEATVAGVRTNFRMPQVVSVACGGGSLVADMQLGPESVGNLLHEKALVFGGSTLTATDLAVACGRADIGDAERVAHVDAHYARTVLDDLASQLSDALSRLRTSAAPLPVVAVGGGAWLLPSQLAECGELIRPDHGEVANAIGAATAQVSGEVDRVYSIPNGRRATVVDEAKSEAEARALSAGACPHSLAIVECSEIPIPYLPGNTTRIRVKAVGDVAVDSPQ